MSANTSAAAFPSRIESLTPTLRRIARATVGTESEYDAEDLYQTIVLKLLERVAIDPSFAERPDQQIITFAIWRARSKAESGRIYTRYCPSETYITDDDGDMLSELEFIPDSAANPEDQVVASEIIHGVDQLISDPIDRRIAAMLVQGYDGVEIGAVLGITKGAVSQRKAKIAAVISAYLEEG